MFYLNPSHLKSRYICSVPLPLSFPSTFLYLKFLVVWVLVLLADFVLEFRFEYLWPFWLFIRSVYDSFRYQGLVCACVWCVYGSLKPWVGCPLTLRASVKRHTRVHNTW